MTTKLAVVYTAANAQQAHLLKNILVEMGISAQVTNELLQAAAGELPFGWAGAPRVVVDEADAVQARQVALEFDRRPPGELESEVGGDGDLRWSKWPVCPACGRRRQAVCPVCETAGSNLPLAEFLAPTAPVRSTRPVRSGEYDPQADESILLMCPNCDEAFRPRFYKRCENCGHDFGFGVAVHARSATETNPRVMLVIAGLLALTAAAILYVWWLFR